MNVSLLASVGDNSNNFWNSS